MSALRQWPAVEDPMSGPPQKVKDMEGTRLTRRRFIQVRHAELPHGSTTLYHGHRQSVSQGFICEIITKRADTCGPTIEECEPSGS